MSQGNRPSFDLGDVDAFPCQPELVALFETLVNVMFCAKDATGVYVEVNTAFVRRTGRSSKREVIGRRAGDSSPRSGRRSTRSRIASCSRVRARCATSWS